MDCTYLEVRVLSISIFDICIHSATLWTDWVRVSIYLDCIAKECIHNFEVAILSQPCANYVSNSFSESRAAMYLLSDENTVEETISRNERNQLGKWMIFNFIYSLEHCVDFSTFFIVPVDNSKFLCINFQKFEKRNFPRTRSYLLLHRRTLSLSFHRFDNAVDGRQFHMPNCQNLFFHSVSVGEKYKQMRIFENVCDK